MNLTAGLHLDRQHPLLQLGIRRLIIFRFEILLLVGLHIFILFALEPLRRLVCRIGVLQVDLPQNWLDVGMILLLDIGERVYLLGSTLELKLSRPSLERLRSDDGVEGASRAVHAALNRVLHLLRITARCPLIYLIGLQFQQDLVGIRLRWIDLGDGPVRAVEVLLADVIVIVGVFLVVLAVD